MDREETLELLRSQHDFPGPFDYRIVLDPAAREPLLLAAREALPEGSFEVLGSKTSSRGTYISLHLRARVGSAEDVLRIYAALRGVEGVRSLM